MRIRVYLRVAPTSRAFKFAATGKPSNTPLLGVDGEVLPTVAFGLDLELPAGAFNVPVLKVAAEVPSEALHPCVAVEVIEP